MNELKPCPFCGGEAIMHEGEFPSKHTRHKKEIPKGARFIRSVKFPDGHVIYEYRVKAYTPRCLDTSCIGRKNKQFDSEEKAIEAWNRRADYE